MSAAPQISPLEPTHAEEDARPFSMASVMNALPASIALLNAEGSILTVNGGWREFALANAPGWESQGVGGNYLSVCDRAAVHGCEDAGLAAAGVRAVLVGTEKDFSLEYPCHTDNEQRWFCVTVTPTVEGSRRGALVMHVDITDRKRVERELSRINRALKMLSTCTEMLIRTEREENLLGKACRIAVEIGGYHMAWVGFAERDERHSITPKAHAGHDNGYLAEIKISWADDDPTGTGPAGTCIRTGLTQICEDIERDPLFFHWMDAALSRGYRGVICLPLQDGARTFGVLALYSAEVRKVGSDEVKLLEQLAGDLAYGIVSIRSRLETQHAQNVVLKVAQAVSAGTAAEFFEALTQNMVLALDADGAMIARICTDDRSWVSTLALTYKGQRMENIRYRVLGTPCEGVTLGYTCIHDQAVQAQFPEDDWLAAHGVESYVGIPLINKSGGVVGIMSVFFGTPLAHTALVHSTLKIFAARAAADLERQEADARIQEQASLLDKAQDAIIVRTLDHRILYWNKSAERLYGWTADEAVGRSTADLIYLDSTQLDEAASTVITEGEWTGELIQVSKDGNEVIVEGRWTLVRDEEGRPKSILAINTDITAKKMIEAQFLRAQRMESIGTLAGGVAHDLNNVLAPMVMAVDLLRLSITDEHALAIIAKIERSARRGADMVRQVLSFAKGVEGQRTLIDPREVIREIEQILRDTFPKNIQLQVELPAVPRGFLGDPTQIHQVMMNLCLNARDAMPGGGTLTITAGTHTVDGFCPSVGAHPKKPGDYVSIIVRDTGTGIPRHILDKVFDPFFTTKELGAGTGLGLSTVLGIMNSHGGFIDVATDSSKGTSFMVCFPVDLSSGAAQASDVQDAPLPRGRGEMVLLVDDEAAVREMTSETLEAFGYRTLIARDGAEAVAIYAQRRDEIDVVLTDVMMPVMDGPAAILVLRKMSPDVKIIGASGLTTGPGVAELDKMGVQHFIAKPYTAHLVLTTLEKVLRG